MNSAPFATALGHVTSPPPEPQAVTESLMHVRTLRWLLFGVTDGVRGMSAFGVDRRSTAIPFKEILPALTVQKQYSTAHGHTAIWPCVLDRSTVRAS